MCQDIGCIQSALPGRLSGGGIKAGIMCSRSRQLWWCKLCGEAGLCDQSWKASTEQPCACKLTGRVSSVGEASEQAGQPSSRFACRAFADGCKRWCHCSCECGVKVCLRKRPPRDSLQTSCMAASHQASLQLMPSQSCLQLCTCNFYMQLLWLHAAPASFSFCSGLQHDQALSPLCSCGQCYGKEHRCCTGSQSMLQQP